MKKHFLYIIFLFVITACNYPPKQLHEVAFQGDAQGTYYVVKYYDFENRNFQLEIDSILQAFDLSLSLWVPESIISKVNRNENVKLDPFFIDNYNLAQKIAVETNGAFDCTLGPLIEAWGFGFRQKIKLDQGKVDSLKSFTGHDKVSLEGSYLVKADNRMEINFNAIAQGYSVDLLGAYLNSKGIENYLIDVGGEILGKGYKPEQTKWVVGIQKPTDDRDGEIESQIEVELTDKAFVTSGSYRKYYEENGKRYSHMIDPSTGYPVTHSLLSVTVLANTCAEADGYATAFMVMGLDKAIAFVNQRSDLEAFFIYADENGAMLTFATDGLESLIRE